MWVWGHATHVNDAGFNSTDAQEGFVVALQVAGAKWRGREGVGGRSRHPIGTGIKLVVRFVLDNNSKRHFFRRQVLELRVECSQADEESAQLQAKLLGRRRVGNPELYQHGVSLAANSLCIAVVVPHGQVSEINNEAFEGETRRDRLDGNSDAAPCPLLNLLADLGH